MQSVSFRIWTRRQPVHYGLLLVLHAKLVLLLTDILQSCLPASLSASTPISETRRYRKSVVWATIPQFSIWGWPSSSSVVSIFCCWSFHTTIAWLFWCYICFIIICVKVLHFHIIRYQATTCSLKLPFSEYLKRLLLRIHLLTFANVSMYRYI